MNRQCQSHHLSQESRQVDGRKVCKRARMTKQIFELMALRYNGFPGIDLIESSLARISIYASPHLQPDRTAVR